MSAIIKRFGIRMTDEQASAIKQQFESAKNDIVFDGPGKMALVIQPLSYTTMHQFKVFSCAILDETLGLALMKIVASHKEKRP